MYRLIAFHLFILALLCCLFAGCSEEKKKHDAFAPDTAGNNRGTDSTALDSTSASVPLSTEAPPDSVTHSDSESAPLVSTTDDTDAGTELSQNGPDVSVISPPAAGDMPPGSNSIITSDQAEVICGATANPLTGTPVDARSVTITISGDNASRTVAAAPAAQTGIYSALVHVADFDTGAVTITCDASDLSDAPLTARAESLSYIDHGPEITVFSPQENAAHGTVLNLQFMIMASPLVPGDTAAEPSLDTLSVHLGGKDITSLLVAAPNEPNLFNGIIAFNDPIFDNPIDGKNTVRIQVDNNRLPVGVVGEASVSFVADSKGPTITPISPLAGEILGGQINISASVTDPSGVAAHSVVATVAGAHEVTLESVVEEESLFEGVFDSRVLNDTMIYPNITIRAQDIPGNQSSLGYLVSLDNRPPLISLDPPSIREARTNNESGLTECSWQFDPTGGWDPRALDTRYGDAVDDGESVPQLFEVRARLEDRGNNLLWQSGMDVPIGGVAPNSVTLYLMNDETKALVVDTNNDGFCDSINPALVPSSAPATENEAVVIQMVGLKPLGFANFTGLPTASEAQPPFDTDAESPESACVSGSAIQRPSPICVGSPTTRTIPSAKGDAGIYTVPPAEGDRCMGTPIDAVATQLSDGWICMAAAASDTLGTVGISAPIRICIDHDGDGAECPAWGTITTENLPNCTGTFNTETETADPATPCLLRDPQTSPNAGHPASWYFEDYPEYQLVFP